MVIAVFSVLGESADAASYTPRLSLPNDASSIKYYNRDSSKGWGNYNPYPVDSQGRNCTWYAFGRAWEILGYFPEKLVFSGDAGTWFDSNKNNYDTGKGGFPYSTDRNAPALGAVAVWKDTSKNDGSGGHVAIVEKITNNSNGAKTIVTSESAWGSYYFQTTTRSTAEAGLGWSGKWSFVGYIYLQDALAPYESTINLDPCGGSVSPTSFGINYGEYWKFPTPTRSGYTFGGWYSQKDGKGDKYSNDMKYWGHNETRTIYAYWIQNTPTYESTINLDPCGGSVSPTSFGINYGDYWTLPTPTRPGYTFDGWYSEKDGKGSKYVNTDRYWGKNETKTVYANWTKDTIDPPPTEIPQVHFPRTASYIQGQFTDVPNEQWFTNNVADAYSFGLMKGNSANTFNPYGDVTLAEAITMAARIHSIYTTGTEDFIPSEKWYEVYLDYAFQNGIITDTYYNSNVTEKATRAQFAEIFANALPADGLYAINSIANNSIPDVKITDSYAPSVYKLYRAGILAGGDVKGTFSPGTFITRAECAAIVSRMAESDNRIAFSLS